MAKKVCNSCKTENAPVPFAAFEAEQTRAERREKRLVWLIALLIMLLVGSNFAWLVYENSFEDVTITQEVEQDAENGENHFIGGDYIGEAESENNN